MGLETTTTIGGLVSTNPVASDALGQADDHIRLLKTVLKTIFPGSGGSGFTTPITASEAELNYVVGVTSAIQTQLNTHTSNIATAQSTANTGVSNAATADGKAVAAQGTANTALANAATADGKAVAAQADAATALAAANNAATKANAARAWVIFDDDLAGNCTILESSSNVTSVVTGTDGVYEVNLSPALTDSTFAVLATCFHSSCRIAVCYSATSSFAGIKTYDAAGVLANSTKVSVMLLSAD